MATGLPTQKKRTEESQNAKEKQKAYHTNHTTQGVGRKKRWMGKLGRSEVGEKKKVEGKTGIRMGKLN